MKGVSMRLYRVLAVTVAALLAVAACSEGEPTSASPVPASPHSSAVPATDGPVTYFYGLGLHLGTTWQAVTEGAQPDVRTVVVETACSMTPRFACPGFVVAPIEQDPSVRADMRLENGCWSNGVTDDRYFDFPERLGPATVGRQVMEYYRYSQCSRETHQKGTTSIYMWRSAEKEVVLYELKPTGGTQQIPGLEALLEGAVWQR